MTSRTEAGSSVTWLFVPGDREDRFDRAARSGADEVVLDLEDAVASDAKGGARAAVGSWLAGEGTGWVRVNAVATAWQARDVTAVRDCPGLRGVVVPMAEDPAALRDVREQLPEGAGLVALVETAAGIDRAAELARSGAVDRLAFGSVDFALDIGAEETDEAMLFARSSLVIASRVGGLPPPVDGVTTAVDDEAAARTAAARACSLGFGGKLCIHPRQVAPVADGFRPTPAQLDWADRVLAAAGAEETGVVSVDGQMVDRPVLARARSIRARGGGSA